MNVLKCIWNKDGDVVGYLCVYMCYMYMYVWWIIWLSWLTMMLLEYMYVYDIYIYDG
jgi:hypothetical protein